MSENLSAAELARQLLRQDAEQREQSAPATYAQHDAVEPAQPERDDQAGERAAMQFAQASPAQPMLDQEGASHAIDARPQDDVNDAAASHSEASSAAAPSSEIREAASLASPALDGELSPELKRRIYSLTEQPDEALAAASEAIRAGKCIVLPTDTVYGIGANAFDARAVQALLDAKQRGRDMPPPVLIAEPELLPALVAEISESAQSLVYAFWPGALTLICNAQTGMQLDLGQTGGTIAIRVPDHELTRELLRATGPLAVSSANLSGRAAATDVESAARQLGEAVEVYLDGGPTLGNMPSTIVDFSQTNTGQIIRHGALSFDQLRDKAPFLTDVVNSDA